MKFCFYTYENGEKLENVFDNIEDALQAARKYVLSEKDLKNDYVNAWFNFAVDGLGEITVTAKGDKKFVIKGYNEAV